MLRVVSHWIQVPTKRAGYLLIAFLWQAARFEPARSSKAEPEPEPEPNGEASAKAAGRLAFGAGAAVGSVPGEGESFANPVAEAGDDDGGNATVRPPFVSKHSFCVHRHHTKLYRQDDGVPSIGFGAFRAMMSAIADPDVDAARKARVNELERTATKQTREEEAEARDDPVGSPRRARFGTVG